MTGNNDPANGCGTWYLDEGDPASPVAVLLSHGVGLDLTMWDHLAATLARDHRVLRHDMLGHGRSPALNCPATLEDFHDQVVALLDKAGVETVVMVGFSMGGLLAQSLAARCPERLRGLVLMSTVYRREEAEKTRVRERLRITEQEGPEAIVDLAVDRWFPAAFQAAHPEAVEAVRRRLATNDPRGYTDAYRVFVESDLGPVLRGVDCPALVLTGSEDPGSTPEMAYRMGEDLANAEVVILEGLRHMVTVEDPGQVDRLLLDFLVRLETRA